MKRKCKASFGAGIGLAIRLTWHQREESRMQNQMLPKTLVRPIRQARLTGRRKGDGFWSHTFKFLKMGLHVADVIAGLLEFVRKRAYSLFNCHFFYLQGLEPATRF